MKPNVLMRTFQSLGDRDTEVAIALDVDLDETVEELMERFDGPHPHTSVIEIRLVFAPEED